MTAPEAFMRLALAEAEKGVGRTRPNPAVGAVLVRGGKVLARGFHERAGAPHAERVVLSAAGARARGANLYVTLEPCNHHGRTPPCAEAILAAGVRRVYTASSDPNPLVAGRGVRALRRAGVTVVEGLLRDEADALNRPFFKFMKRGLPWVALKAAVTLDGQLAAADGSSRWVTGPEARAWGQRLRDRYDAVLVGAGTVAQDDPRLTTRLPGGRDAVRIVLDSRLRLSPSRKIFTQSSKALTVVATTLDAQSPRARRLRAKGVEVWTVGGKDGRVDLRQVLRRITDAGLRSVLVEGGAQVHASFLRGGWADVLYLFLAPKLLGAGGLTWSGPLGVASMDAAMPGRIERVDQLGKDVLIEASLGSGRASNVGVCPEGRRGFQGVSRRGG